MQFLSGCSTAPPSGMKDCRDLLLNMWKYPGGHCYWKGEQPKVYIHVYIYMYIYIYVYIYICWFFSCSLKHLRLRDLYRLYHESFLPRYKTECPTSWPFLVKFLNPSSSQKLKGISLSTTHSCAKMTSCRSRQEDSLDYLTPVFRHRCSTYFKIIAQSIVFFGVPCVAKKNPGAETFTRGVYGCW